MHAMRKSVSETPRPKSFVELVRNNGGSAVHVVRTYDEAGRACWFMLKANELNLVKLERTVFEDMIDLTQYGEVVASGWGHEPDAHALASDA